MAEDIYKRIKPVHKPSPDWQMPTITVFGVVLLCVLGGIIFAIMRTQYLFNTYKTDLLYSVLYARNNESFAIYDGALLAGREMPEEIRGVLTLRGRPLKAMPERPADMTVLFGDGSFILLWESEFADYSEGHGAVMEPGIIYDYTNAAGKNYCIETAADFPYLRAYLLGWIADYYHPTEEELAQLSLTKDESS